LKVNNISNFTLKSNFILPNKLSCRFEIKLPDLLLKDRLMEKGLDMK